MSGVTHLRGAALRDTLIIQLHSLLVAVEEGVLGAARDISPQHKGEIRRELWLLRLQVDRLRNDCRITHIEGSAHLRRWGSEQKAGVMGGARYDLH